MQQKTAKKPSKLSGICNCYSSIKGHVIPEISPRLCKDTYSYQFLYELFSIKIFLNSTYRTFFIF